MPSVDPRILQANERTLLAWVRTGLGLMAFGFVVARLALWMEGKDDRFELSLYFGVAIVGLGAACQIVGATRFRAARNAIVAGEEIESGTSTPIAIAVIVAAVGVGLVLYLLAAR